MNQKVEKTSDIKRIIGQPFINQYDADIEVDNPNLNLLEYKTIHFNNCKFKKSSKTSANHIRFQIHEKAMFVNCHFEVVPVFICEGRYNHNRFESSEAFVDVTECTIDASNLEDSSEKELYPLVVVRGEAKSFNMTMSGIKTLKMIEFKADRVIIRKNPKHLIFNDSMIIKLSLLNLETERIKFSSNPVFNLKEVEVDGKTIKKLRETLDSKNRSNLYSIRKILEILQGNKQWKEFIELNKVYSDIAYSQEKKFTNLLIYKVLRNFYSFKRALILCVLFIVCFSLVYYIPTFFDVETISKTVNEVNKNGESLPIKYNEYLYFSLITFTTVGYGDFRPVGVFQIIAGIQGFFGVVSAFVLSFIFTRKYSNH